MQDQLGDCSDNKAKTEIRGPHSLCIDSGFTLLEFNGVSSDSCRGQLDHNQSQTLRKRVKEILDLQGRWLQVPCSGWIIRSVEDWTL